MIFAIITIILIIARLGLFTALHLTKNPYNPIKHAVSDYNVGETRKLSNIMVGVTTLIWMSLAGAVATSLGDWATKPTIIVQLAVLTIIFIVLPRFPADLEGKKLTPIGIAHYALAIGWFYIAYAVSNLLNKWIDSEVGGITSTTSHYLHILLAVSIVATLISRILPKLRNNVFGLVERVFLTALFLFFLNASLAMILV